jgi:hypothetical protein
MPRLEVDLPEELYAELVRRQLPVRELVQQAVRAEIAGQDFAGGRRQELIDAAGAYLRELTAEVGEPSAEDLAWAEGLARRIKQHLAGQTA